MILLQVYYKDFTEEKMHDRIIATNNKQRSSKMFIGKNGEDIAGGAIVVPQEQTEAVWMLVLAPKSNNPITNISGLCCTLKNIQAVITILEESEDCVRNKLIVLGHQGEPAVLKIGNEDELKSVGKSLSGFVCGCHFELQILPVQGHH
jgi:hypothetical protein